VSGAMSAILRFLAEPPLDVNAESRRERRVALGQRAKTENGNPTPFLTPERAVADVAPVVLASEVNA
jgi:hypothetical protein